MTENDTERAGRTQAQAPGQSATPGSATPLTGEEPAVTDYGSGSPTTAAGQQAGAYGSPSAAAATATFPTYGPAPGSGTLPPATAPPVGSPSPARLLRRSRDDRMVAGVCGGLARYWNTDPVLLRILTVVLTIATGGALLVGYAIAWIAIHPEEPPAGTWPGYPYPGAGQPVAGPSWVTTSAAAGAAVAPQGAHSTDPSTAPASGQPWDYGTPAAGPAADPMVSTSDGEPQVGGAYSSADPYRTSDPVGAPLGYAYGGAPPYSGIPAAGSGYPGPTPTPPRKERSYLGWLVLSTAVLVLGVLALIAAFAPVGVSIWGAACAVALTVLGLGLVVGTWYGRARWLIILAVPLAFLTFATVSAANWVQANPNWDRWNDPGSGGTTFGDRIWDPTPAEVAASEGLLVYNLSAGSAVLDLRELGSAAEDDFQDAAEPVRIDAGVGLGRLVVLVPPDMRLDLTASVDLGEIRVSGEDPISGNDLDLTTTVDPVTTQVGAIVKLDAAIGAGTLEVRHETA